MEGTRAGMAIKNNTIIYETLRMGCAREEKQEHTDGGRGTTYPSQATDADTPHGAHVSTCEEDLQRVLRLELDIAFRLILLVVGVLAKLRAERAGDLC